MIDGFVITGILLYFSVAIVEVVTLILLVLISEKIIGKCILFHEWGKWEAYKKDDTFVWGGDAMTVDNEGNEEIEALSFSGSEIRKRRICSRCGKVQDKHVEDLFL